MTRATFFYQKENVERRFALRQSSNFLAIKTEMEMLHQDIIPQSYLLYFMHLGIDVSVCVDGSIWSVTFL